MSDGRLFSRVREVKPNSVVYWEGSTRVYEMLVQDVLEDCLYYMPLAACVADEWVPVRKKNHRNMRVFGVKQAIKTGKLRRMP